MGCIVVGESEIILLTLILFGGGGGIGPCDAKFREKCPCSHNNTTALIKQIFLFDTAAVITNTKDSIQKKKKRGVKKET